MDPLPLYINVLCTQRLVSGPFHSWIKNYISAFASEKGPTLFAVSLKLLSQSPLVTQTFRYLPSRERRRYPRAHSIGSRPPNPTQDAEGLTGEGRGSDTPQAWGVNSPRHFTKFDFRGAKAVGGSAALIPAVPAVPSGAWQSVRRLEICGVWDTGFIFPRILQFAANKLDMFEVRDPPSLLWWERSYTTALLQAHEPVSGLRYCTA